MSLQRNDRTTTKLLAHAVDPDAVPAAARDLELVVQYATPIVRLRVQERIDGFVTLANAGFFGDTIPGGTPCGAEAGRETLGESADERGVVLGAWLVRIVGIGDEGIGWLARALALSGAHLEWSTLGLGARDARSTIRPAASSLPFRSISRRGAGGYYIRITLGRVATDEDEAAFHRLIKLWMLLVRHLPSRDGRGPSRFTTRPSYERGGNVLAVAGRELDAADEAAALSLFGAISRFHREQGRVVETLLDLG